MINQLRSFFFFCFFLPFYLQAVEKVSMVDLHTYADACNNEGGLVAQNLDPSQKWMSLHFILDRPLQTQETFEEITNSNSFLLKESSILSYKEARVNQCCLLILTYLIDHLRDLCSLREETTAQLTIHVHRNSSGIKHINHLLVHMLRDYYGLEKSEQQNFLDKGAHSYQIKMTFPHKTEVIFRNGYDPKTFKNYEGSHIILSLGLVMGLNPKWEASTILLPEEFIPTDEKAGIIYESQKYISKNYLKDCLLKITQDEERQKKVISLINSNPMYQSPNQEKTYEVLTPLVPEDFHFPKILQIQTLWSPHLQDPSLEIQ